MVVIEPNRYPNRVNREYPWLRFAIEGARCYSRSAYNSAAMKYVVQEVDDWFINLTVPYVPYEHFQLSRGHRDGFTYADYMNVWTHLLHFNDRGRVFKLKENMCRAEDHEIEKLPVKSLKVGAQLLIVYHNEIV